MYSRNTRELANKFNEFFTSVGSHTANKSKRLAAVKNHPVYDSPPTNIILDSDEFRFRAVTTVEVRKIIQSCPLNKAPEKDKVHMKVILNGCPTSYTPCPDRADE